MLHTQLSTGFIIGTVIAGIIIFACTVIGNAGIVSLVRGRNDSYGSDWGVPVVVITLAVAIVTLGIYGFATFPWTTQYHKYVPISGVVQNVGSRFISDGTNSTEQAFSVELNGQTYRCDDTRCSQLHKGSPVTLMCIREWQFNGTPGYTCNWGKDSLND